MPLLQGHPELLPLLLLYPLPVGGEAGGPPGALPVRPPGGRVRGEAGREGGHGGPREAGVQVPPAGAGRTFENLLMLCYSLAKIKHKKIIKKMISIRN